jgi:transcription elongation factor GreA
VDKPPSLIYNRVLRQALPVDCYVTLALWHGVEVEVRVLACSINPTEVHQQMTEKPVYLTRDGRERLQAELETLIRVTRLEVASRIAQAKDLGDLSENAEYEAAKHEQAFVEGRIRELQHQLSNAQLIDEGVNGDKMVRIGSSVTVVDEEDGEEMTYTIVGSAEAKPREGKISNESPVGAALLGKKRGQKVKVPSPDGSYKLLIRKIC